MGDRRPQREPGAAADTLHSSGRHTTSPPDRPGQVRPGSRGCRGTPSWTSLVSTPGQGQGTKVPTPQPRFYAHSDHEVKEPEFEGDGASNPHHGPPSPFGDVGCAFKASITRAGSVRAPHISVTISAKS